MEEGCAACDLRTVGHFLEIEFAGVKSIFWEISTTSPMSLWMIARYTRCKRTDRAIEELRQAITRLDKNHSKCFDIVRAAKEHRRG